MKHIEILVLVTVIAVLFVIAGLSGRRFLFIDGPRTAAIALGVVGMALCAISVGKAITTSPAGLVSILGYVIGAAALLTFLTQIFKWDMPVVGDPKTALIVLASCMVVKSILARFIQFMGNR